MTFLRGWNFWKLSFLQTFFSKPQNVKYPNFMEIKIWTKVCYIWKTQMFCEHISQVKLHKDAIFFSIFTFSCKFPSKNQLSKPSLRYNLTSKFQASMINRVQMAGFSIFDNFSLRIILSRLYCLSYFLLTIYFPWIKYYNILPQLMYFTRSLSRTWPLKMEIFYFSNFYLLNFEPL